MIFYETNHFFDAKYPTLEDHEEEIWYPHPLYDIKCNQLGILDFADELKAQLNGRDQYKVKPPGSSSYKTLGYKERVVMECYTGISHKSTKILFQDGNPLNHTFGNLMCFRKKGSDYRHFYKIQRDFIINSIKYMNSREPFIVKRGIDPEDYWRAMALPSWLMDEWFLYNKRTSNQEPTEKLTRGKYIKGDDQLELLRRIWELKNNGYSWQEMMEEIGSKSRSGFSYLLKKAETYFDI